MVADEPRAARNGFTNLFGKLDDEPINGLKLPVEVKARLKSQAEEAGMPFQEFLREKLTISAFGRGEIESRFQARLDAIEGTVKE